MFERYTEKARRVIFFARYEASQFGSTYIETDHLLLGMAREDTALAKRLSRPPFTLEFIRQRIKEEAPAREKIPTSVDMPLSAGCKRVLNYAAEEADRLADKHIGTNHLLLGLIREKGGLAAKVLSEAGINASELRSEIGRMSDTTRKVAHPQQARHADYVEIHGELWGADSVHELGEYYRKFHWENRQWVARDALVYRSSSALYLYSGQPYDPNEADILKGGWSEDHCAICWWRLFESEETEHRWGFTNGQDWLCVECYTRFIERDPADGGTLVPAP